MEVRGRRRIAEEHREHKTNHGHALYANEI
jgi:hypothetical protein